MAANPTLSLHVQAGLYIVLGFVHLLQPALYLAVMPPWLPYPIALIYLGGIAEIILGALLIPGGTRRWSAWLIIAMLVLYFFVIHVPQAIDYYRTGNSYWWLTVLRLPLQFVLIAWAWKYTR